MIALAPGIVNCKCKLCGHCQTIEVPQRDLDMFNDGMAVQDAFPYLGGNLRGFIIHSICPTCFESIYLNLGNDNASHNSVDGSSRVFK